MPVLKNRYNFWDILAWLFLACVVLAAIFFIVLLILAVCYLVATFPMQCFITYLLFIIIIRNQDEKKI